MPTRPVWAEISIDRLTWNFNLLRRIVQSQSQSSETAPQTDPQTSFAAAQGFTAQDLATQNPPDSGLPLPELLAVVKADAYGHGVQVCGSALAAAGARWLGVTSVEEGATLRRALGVLPSPLSATRILVMSSLWLGEADTILDRALTPQVWEPFQCALLREAAIRRGLGPATVPVHLEIDTGMARQGVAPGPRLATLLAEAFPPDQRAPDRSVDQRSDSPLHIEGVMTHFSAPEMLREPDTNIQLARFSAALEQLAAANIHPRWIHAGNSATLFDAQHIAALTALATRHGARLLLRPGLALYGYPVRFTPPALASADASPHLRLEQHQLPPDQLAQEHLQRELQPVLAWKTRIVSLRDLAPGQGAGYNSTFRAVRPTRLALVPVGYADGLNRLLSNRGAMLVHGHQAAIVGRISMDQTLLDVTSIPSAAIGDEVVILGEQASTPPTAGNQDDPGPTEPPLGLAPAGPAEQPSAQPCPPTGLSRITAWEHADLCGTIPYEILCNLAARVPRGILD